MDPLTAIGAVASIWQIAQSAISLSKTLYTLAGALGSAAEDIRILADDLKTFSQSLTLLSRLLEDSKSWYTDDIYLLTAKIINDCADLYAKIDKILEKLGRNGKSTWKLRVRFVYQETQIRKLLDRLRCCRLKLESRFTTSNDAHMKALADYQTSLMNLNCGRQYLVRLKRERSSDVHDNAAIGKCDSLQDLPSLCRKVRNVDDEPETPVSLVQNTSDFQAAMELAGLPAPDISTSAGYQGAEYVVKHTNVGKNKDKVKIYVAHRDKNGEVAAEYYSSDGETAKPKKSRRKSIMEGSLRLAAPGAAAKAAGSSRDGRDSSRSYGSPAATPSFVKTLDGDVGLNLLENFDFDSFLRPNSQDSQVFILNAPESSKPEGYGDALESTKKKGSGDLGSVKPGVSLEQREASPALYAQHTARGTTASTVQDCVRFVNQKQFRRIIKRRVARQQLEDRLAKQKSSRHLYFHIRTYKIPARQAHDEQDTETEVNDETDVPNIDEQAAGGESPQSAQTTLASHSLPTADVDNEDSETVLVWPSSVLSPIQTSKLWWQAYLCLISSPELEPEPENFKAMKNRLESTLGILTLRHLPDDVICIRISDVIRRLATAPHDDEPELHDLLDMRSNILRIFATIDERLGLEIATLGWSCVCVLLTLYEKILNIFSSSQTKINNLTASFTHLQDIVAIIARYAVMENLYQQTGGALSLKSEYHSALSL